MGLSVAIAGGIVCATLVGVLSILFSVTSHVNDVNSARSQSSELDANLAHTNAAISYLYAQSANDRVSFTVQNTGTEKLWNYDKFSVLVTYNASIAGSPQLTSEYLSYNPAQSFGGNGVSSGSTQYARPDSDVTKDNWTTGTGSTTNLYAEIDESTQNDSDYDKSGQISLLDTTETLEVGLSNVIDPETSSNHIVRYAYGKDASGGAVIDLTVSLMQGTTQIASWTHNDIGTGFTLATQTLSAAQADSITNYSDLRLRFVATYSSGIVARSAQISWAEFEVPPATGVYDCSAVTVTAGKWTIDRITGDLFDPKILNSNEEAKICIKLSNNVHSGSNVTVMLTTDLGKTKSSTITV
ncbi:MAG: hypothetical protein QXN55_02285 [Candidatus Nitrosotenuis sp.]|jgi:archaellum component FlaF (FlaF/FlaG flagellin family)